jgi:hypothetical protein
MTSDLQTILDNTSFLKPEDDLASLAGQIKAEFEKINPALLGGFRTALGHAFRVGELLTQAKPKVPRGKWLEWVEQNTPLVSVRTAQLYMQLHRRQPEIEAAANAQSVALFKALSMNGALGLLAGPLEKEEEDGEAKDAEPKDGADQTGDGSDDQQEEPELTKAEKKELKDQVHWVILAERRYMDALGELSELSDDEVEKAATRLMKHLRSYLPE